LTEEQFIALKYGSPKTRFAGVNFFAPTESSTSGNLHNKKKYPDARNFLLLRRHMPKRLYVQNAKAQGLDCRECI